MAATLTVSVPGGHWVDGVRHRDVELRPPSAREQLVLADAGPGPDASPAARFTRVLSRCVVRLGPVAGVGPEVVRGLAVGDREALALHLRRELFGERMTCVVSCPVCHEDLDLDLDVDRLLVPAYADARPWYETTAEDSGTTFRVRFRLPTGADQEGVAALAGAEPEAAADEILHRCLLDVRGDGRSGEGLPPAVAAGIPALMADLDPQAVTLLDMSCPACEGAFVVPFSPSAHLARELADRSARLIGDVHALALHYHWSESDILSLPERRRQAYLGLLDPIDAPSWTR